MCVLVGMGWGEGVAALWDRVKSKDLLLAEFGQQISNFIVFNL